MAAVYEATYCEHPWEEDVSRVAQSYPRELARDSKRPGFLCFAAFETEDLIGFTYGTPMSPEEEEAFAAWLNPTPVRDGFLLYEICVKPTSRGKGIGGRLHDSIIGEVSAPRMLLQTHTGADAAMHLYRSRGWRIAREWKQTASGSRAVMILEKGDR